VERGYSFVWKDGQLPKLTKRDGTAVPLDVQSYVSMLRNDSQQAYSARPSDAESGELSKKEDVAIKQEFDHDVKLEEIKTVTARVDREVRPAETAPEVDPINVDRTKACEKAKEILLRCLAGSRRVEDYEVLQRLQLWGFKNNSNGKNVRPDSVDHIMSDTLGVIHLPDTGATLLSPSSTKFPAFTKLLAAWCYQHVPDDHRDKFVYSSINVNKNYAGKLHRDRVNVGSSFIKAFGDFRG